MGKLANYKGSKLDRFRKAMKLRDYTEVEKNTVAIGLVAKLSTQLAISSGKVEHLNDLKDLIVDFYDHYSPEEIMYAFRLYITHELEEKPIQNLTSVAFGNVMASYVRYKSEKIRQSQPKKHTEITESEKERLMLDAYDRALKEVKKNGKFISNETRHHIFDWLFKTGRIKEVDQDLVSRSKDRAIGIISEDLLESAKGDRKKHRDAKRVIATLDHGSGGRVKSLGKTIYLEEYLKSKINDTGL